MGGKTTDVGNPDDYQFLDPTGRYMGAMDQFSSQYQNLQDPNSYMNAFMNQQAGLANIAQGATAPLSQSLAAVAEQRARQGGEQALAAMPGARFSGAAMQAFGDAYAQPFAEAAAQTQAAQLGLTGNLWNNAMGNTAQSYQNALNLAGGMYGNFAQGTGMQYSPTYQYQPGVWDRLMQAGQLASSFFPFGGGGGGGGGSGYSPTPGGRNVQ